MACRGTENSRDHNLCPDHPCFVPCLSFLRIRLHVLQFHLRNPAGEGPPVKIQILHKSHSSCLLPIVRRSADCSSAVFTNTTSSSIVPQVVTGIDIPGPVHAAHAFPYRGNQRRRSNCPCRGRLAQRRKFTRLPPSSNPNPSSPPCSSFTPVLYIIDHLRIGLHPSEFQSLTRCFGFSIHV